MYGSTQVADGVRIFRQQLLSAVAHLTRLGAFRLLARHEPGGFSTGQLVAASDLTQSTFSTQLAVFVKADLVKSEKRGRQMIQRANIDALRALMLFLVKDCDRLKDAEGGPAIGALASVVQQQVHGLAM